MIQDLKKSAFRNMQWSGLSSGIVSGLQLLNTVILVYFLTPEQFGTMSAMLLIIWFTQYISDGGMSPAIVHQDTNPPGVMNTLYAINIGIAVILYIIVQLLGEQISLIYDESSIQSYLPVAMLSMVVASFGNQFKVVLMKELRFDIIARQEVITAITNSMVTISLAAIGYGVWAMVIGHLSGVAAGNMVLIASSLKFWRPGFRFSVDGIQPYIKFGMYQLGERISLFLNTRLDQLIIGPVLGTSALGIYSVAHNLVISPTTRVNQVISLVMFPVFAKVKDDESILRKGYLKLVKLVTLINTPVMLGLSLTAPLFIPLFFDAEWARSIYIIQILALYALIRSTGSPAGSLQMAKGRADLGFKWNAVLVTLSAPVLYVASSLGGLETVAWTLTIMHALLFFPYWRYTIRPLIGPPAKDYYLAVFGAMVPGFIMAVVVYLIVGDFIELTTKIRLFLGVISGIIVFISSLVVLQKDMVKEIKELYLSRNSSQQK
jgi:O-antigen/teichoic acid export membrane protein